MEVILIGTEDRLCISLVQERDGVQHVFELCDLNMKSLAVGWLWEDPSVFAIAALYAEQLHFAIFVYPTSRHRDEWLYFFQDKRVYTAPFSLFEKMSATLESVHLISVVREDSESSFSQLRRQ